MRGSTLMIVIVAILLAGSAPAQPRTGPHAHRSVSYSKPPPYQFVFEAGAALPQGDLGDPYINTERGFGAGTGFELGGRLRYFATEALSVGPSFHYTRFGQWEGTRGSGAAQRIRNSIYRFGLDGQYYLSADRSSLRPYITAGAALVFNEFREWHQYEGWFQTTSANLAVSAGAGLALGPMEFSAVWNYNPAKHRLVAEAWETPDASFDWSYLVVRVGFFFGDS